MARTCTLTKYCTLVLLATTCLVRGQDGPALSTIGPCEDITPPCDVLRNYGHPSNCSLFWECNQDSTELVLKQCHQGTTFDVDAGVCKKDATCTSCPSHDVTPPDGDETTGDPEAEPESGEPAEDEDLALNSDFKPLAVNGTDTSETEVPIAEPETDPTFTQPDKTSETNEESPTPLTNNTTIKETTTTSSSSATTTTTQSVPSTSSPTTTKLEKSSTRAGFIPDKPLTNEPPYQIVTESTTQRLENNTVGVADKVQIAGLDKTIIIIVAAVAAGVVLIIIVIIVVVVVCRRQHRRKKHEIQIVENPRYRGAASSGEEVKNYRFSRDDSIYVGNLSDQRMANNNSDEKVDMNSERKKRRAPPPPNPFTGYVDGFPLGRDSVQYYEKLAKKKKRRAPPPPNPFTGVVDGYEQLPGSVVELYEKDTPTGSEVELTTFGTPRIATNLPPGGGDVPDSQREPPSGFTDDSDSDDNRLDDTTDNEPEAEALLDGRRQDSDFRLPTSNRKSIADKYHFSEDEDSGGPGRGSLADRYRYSDEELDNPRSPPYELDDIRDELETPEFSEEDDDYDRTRNPFLL